MLYRTARIQQKPDYPCHWYQLPLGAEIKWLTEQAIARESHKFWGYHLVKLGELSSQVKLVECAIKHQVKHTRFYQSDSSVVAKPHCLPYQSKSIDTFILSHELDFSHDPHGVLREVDRCIVSDGHLVISGFNPFSLAGVASLLPFKKQSLLHQARFFSAARVKDWLSLLGFEIISEQRLLFSELLFENTPKTASKTYQWCDKYLNWLNAVYVIVAKKRESPLSPIKLKWQQRPKFATVGASIG